MAQLSISEFADRISEIMPVMMREFFRQQTKQFYRIKLTAPQLVVLEILSRKDGSRMSDLARCINVTTAAMTGIVERLVRDGYVRRSNDKKDRRIIKVGLTARGDKAVQYMAGQRKKMFTRVFGVLSEKEREEYLNILTNIRDRLKERDAISS